MKMKSNAKGFFYTFEAATAIMLLVIAASTLQLYHAESQDAESFFLCSDAAALLAKSIAAPGGALQQHADRLHSLSGLCISIHLQGESASSCPLSSSEKISLPVPVWRGAARTMRVECWREK